MSKILFSKDFVVAKGKSLNSIFEFVIDKNVHFHLVQSLGKSRYKSIGCMDLSIHKCEIFKSYIKVNSPVENSKLNVNLYYYSIFWIFFMGK